MLLPCETPFLVKLNSYYVDVKKLLDHCQGEIGSGAIHVESSDSCGILYFDTDEMLGGVYEKDGSKITGIKAIEYIITLANNFSVTINVYKIDRNKIYIWCNIENARSIYSDLSSDFTDLKGLLKKMSAELLTGFIRVSMERTDEEGLILFDDGEFIGGSYSWPTASSREPADDLELLMAKTREFGGVFHVYEIPPEQMHAGEGLGEVAQPPTPRVLALVSDLLCRVERMVEEEQGAATKFSVLLRRKFIEKAERYSFLDPFAGEFEYTDQQAKFVGQASAQEVIDGIVEATLDLSREIGLRKQALTIVAGWREQCEAELSDVTVDL